MKIISDISNEMKVPFHAPTHPSTPTPAPAPQPNQPTQPPNKKY